MANISERLTKAGEKRYQVKVRLRGFPQRTATFRRKADAVRWGQQIENDIRTGRHFASHESSRRSLKQAVERYLTIAPAHLGTGTMVNRRAELAWWVERYGRLKLRELTPAVIAEARDRLAMGETIRGFKASPATQNRYLAALSAVCALAVKEWGWMDDNPCRRVSRRREAKGKERFLEAEEVKTLLEVCASSKAEALRPLVFLALATGARQGELLKLRWAEVDLPRKRIRFRETKNRSDRTVPIGDQAVEVLRELGRVRELGNDRVLRVDSWANNLRAAWDTAVIDSKLDGLRFHDLRHTAASWFAMSGATPNELCELMGWRTLQMAMRYVHFMPMATRDLVDRMNAKLLS